MPEPKLCPSCGALNLPSAKICHDCGYDLSAPPPENNPDQTSPLDLFPEAHKDLPDLLHDLREESQTDHQKQLAALEAHRKAAAEPVDSASQEAAEVDDTAEPAADVDAVPEIPDWLAKIRERSRMELKASVNNAPAADKPQDQRRDQFNRWLENLQPDETESAGQQEVDAAANTAAPVQETDKTPQKMGGSQTPHELPDWLVDIYEGNDEDQSSPSPDVQETAKAEDLPDEAAADDAEDLPTPILGNIPELPAEETPFVVADETAEAADVQEDALKTDDDDEEAAAQPKPAVAETLKPVEAVAQPAHASQQTRAIKPPRPATSDGQPTRAVQTMPPETAASREAQLREITRQMQAGKVTGWQPENSIAAMQPALQRGENPVIQATQQQNTRALLLENLVASEKTAKVLPKAEKHALHWASRLLVGLLLLTAVILPLITQQSIQKPAQVASSAGQLFAAGITSLPTDQPLLVVVDYQAGVAGEMEALAETFLPALISPLRPLVFITSQVQGELMTARLMQKILTINPQAETALFNAGFLPGGRNGLAAFALNPLQMMPVALNGSDIWLGEQGLQQFGAVILLTDAEDGLRGWMEQVQPAAGGVPFYLAASAQIAPLALPYLDSHQVQGMLSGIQGAALFADENATGIASWQYWDSFQAGLLVMVVLMLIGAISGFEAFHTRTQTDWKKGRK